MTRVKSQFDLYQPMRIKDQDRDQAKRFVLDHHFIIYFRISYLLLAKNVFINLEHILFKKRKVFN